MSPRVSGFIVLSVFTLSCGLVYWRASRSPAVPAQPNVRGEVAALRDEIASLKANSAAALLLAQQARRLGETTGEAKPGAGAEAQAADVEASQPPAEAPEALSELEAAVQLDNRFDAEPVDPAWGRAATLEATRALSAGIKDGTAVKAVQCRTNLCRVETLHASLDDFRNFAAGSLLGRERQIWNGGVSTLVRSESEDGVTAVTYIAKEGQPVPVPEHD
jgi:hypothetical protein